MKFRWQIWLGIILLGLFIYGTRGILLPFVAGFAFAYLLDPVTDRIERLGVARWAATALVLAVFFLGIAAIVVALIPMVQAQFLGIIESLPRYIAALRPLIDETIQRLADSLSLEAPGGSEGVTTRLIETAFDNAGRWIGNIFTQTFALFNLLSLLIISPVVAFFMLRDWDLIIAKIDSWLPSDHAATIRSLARQIDDALAGFVRGQTVVVVIMGTLYAIGWSLAGLNYSLILGILAGVLAYVPFVGALFAALIAMLVGFGQFGADFGALAAIFGVFVVVQLLEGTVFTPRLIGSHVGLHPVWVLFAIFAGGQLLGFVGVLISLPVAAATGVLVRFVVDRYLDSDLHLGNSRGAGQGEASAAPEHPPDEAQ